MNILSERGYIRAFETFQGCQIRLFLFNLTDDITVFEN